MKKFKSSVFCYMKLIRIVPGFSLKSLGAILLLPYLLTFLLGNFCQQETMTVWAPNLEKQLTQNRFRVINQTKLGKEVIPLEVYVADKLTRSINTDFELETLKAQAVLIRTNLFASSQGSTDILVKDENYGSQHIPEKAWQAAAQTAGVYATLGGQAINTPYFAVSNGATRNGSELLSGNTDYLQSVLCSRDFLSEDYTSSISYEMSEFNKIWQTINGCSMTAEELQDKEKYTKLEAVNLEEKFILYRDSVGYVLFVENLGKVVTGEQFREAYALLSGSFHLEADKKSVLITVKGSGHGFGMSQYGANEQAKQEKDYIEIIETFFKDILITKNE